MWATVTMGELVALMALFALILAVTTALVWAVVAAARAQMAQSRNLKALYVEVELNVAALERWGLDAARVRRDRAPAAFAPRRAVFQAVAADLPRAPQSALERLLDFYAALETLERMTIQVTLNSEPSQMADAFAALEPTAQAAAALGRRALFSFNIEGAVPASTPMRVPAEPPATSETEAAPANENARRQAA